MTKEKNIPPSEEGRVGALIMVVDAMIEKMVVKQPTRKSRIKINPLHLAVCAYLNILPCNLVRKIINLRMAHHGMPKVTIKGMKYYGFAAYRHIEVD
jgi:hypothetical protein